ncbi:MAG: DUF1232 domain-containing protein [Candidatus Electryonea clarkiae]|nr:DUF1232 domain-containing protein [Candidatus Electryonea clarkiae]MDP8285964.1 DUF1232 domain-containing protein [Candidatus Electryonea clarkiae]
MDEENEFEDSKDYYEDFYQKLNRIIEKQLKKHRLDNDEQGKTKYDILVSYLTLLPNLFHLAVRMLLDKSIPPDNKGALIAGIIYVISPIDIIPDAIPIAGWIDDLIVIAMALNKFLDSDDVAIQARVRKHWAGDTDVFNDIKHILEVANSAAEFLPKNLMRIVKSMFK